MAFAVRPATPADAAGIAAVWAAATPHLVKTAAGIESELLRSTKRRVLVAVEHGEVVGYGNARFPTDEQARSRTAVQVPPAQRRRGIGSAMADAVAEAARDAGARSLLTVVGADDASRGFATRRGFTLGRELSHSRASLATLPDPVPVPEGLRLASYTEVDPREVWKASAAVVGGDPSGLSTAPSYQEWLATDWDHPDLVRELSIALLDGGGSNVVSFVTTTADPARNMVWSNLTGTLPSHRGRGLAKVVKSVALHRARDAGFTDAFTGNDANNLPMLAVNRWLGYQVVSISWTATKDL